MTSTPITEMVVNSIITNLAAGQEVAVGRAFEVKGVAWDGGRGIRDVDNFEKENIRKAGVEVFTMRDIDERGMRAVMEEALRMAGRGTAGYHVSLDMDWIDPEDAPGVGTPVRGGATYREAHLAMEIIADHGRMTSFEIVEVNPVIDEHNRTAALAVELTLSAFGKKIV